MYKKITIALLFFGATFFAFEAVIHFFGLPVLEHDKIFLPTHDRYIAILAATYAGLLILIATNIKKYGHLFILVMMGILAQMANALYISRTHAYARFDVVTLNQDLGIMGYTGLVWCIALWVAWCNSPNKNVPTN